MDRHSAFFEELAEFYDRKGYSKIGHSRMARYEILRAFMSEKDWADPVYDQCMVLGSVCQGTSEEPSGICTGFGRRIKSSCGNMTRDLRQSRCMWRVLDKGWSAGVCAV